jgi:S1-C subfamily serine protease
MVPGMGQPLVPTPIPAPAPSYVFPGMGQPATPAAPGFLLGAYGEEVPGVGVYLTTVFQQSAAEQMGLEMGDTIVQVNGSPIRSFYDLQVAVANSGGFVRLLVLDNRTQSYQWVSGYLQ